MRALDREVVCAFCGGQAQDGHSLHTDGHSLWYGARVIVRKHQGGYWYSPSTDEDVLAVQAQVKAHPGAKEEG